MKWRKLGRVFCPDGEFEWMQSHAANPTAAALGSGYFRVYFSSRDARNRSSICWIELDMRFPTKVLRIGEQPVVGPGRPGSFDDSGASMGCIVRATAGWHLYYVGWNLGVTAPWRNSIGLAVGKTVNGSFSRYSEGPILDRNPIDPYSISYPCVLRDGDRWHMWYGSNQDWGPTEAQMSHVIKYAHSDDGTRWSRDGAVALTHAHKGEFALARPCVLAEGDTYRMWYSYRGTNYRIGYAESSDGKRWARNDPLAGISTSEQGWDSESVEYPWVFRHESATYMLYNGNGYGRTGFGIAVLES
jgi:predicted GH43/DUF377 family glycosyl hydrolase